MKAVIATPTLTRPHQAYLDALAASVSVLDICKIEHQTVFEAGCPYISHARAKLLRKALDADADCIVFIDHDVSWRPEDLVALITSEDDVTCGTYRFKKDEEEYMALIDCHTDGRPVVRRDGAIRATRVPAGFLKVTRAAVQTFMKAYPELVFGDPIAPHVDLFNHGAIDGTWFGEDYAFSKRWVEAGGDIWLLPDMHIDHHGDKPYEGNFHQFLMRQPGGSSAPKEIYDD